MKPILILYASHEGHTHRIAEHVADLLGKSGHVVAVWDAKLVKEPFDLTGYSSAILAASVHVGKHERAMVAFVKRHREELDHLPSAFLSVSLSEAGAEDLTASPQKRQEAAEAVEGTLATFFEETGWHPARVSRVAGSLAYTQYGLLIRFVMKRIARAAGASTDTSRDHVLTDWVRVDHFVSEFVKLLPADVAPGTTRAGCEPSGHAGDPG